MNLIRSLFNGALHEGLGPYKETFYVSGSLAVPSTMLLFGVAAYISRLTGL